MTRSSITWFEIPAVDLDRAQRFYETVLASAMRREAIGGSQLAVFAADEDGIAGCLQHAIEPVAPSAEGTRVYLDASPSLDAALARVAAAGGQVVSPKIALPPGMGYFAHIQDCEGNRVGLHAMA
jgi:predicted enzyme related to lactoylglutathione lyase